MAQRANQLGDELLMQIMDDLRQDVEEEIEAESPTRPNASSVPRQLWPAAEDLLERDDDFNDTPVLPNDLQSPENLQELIRFWISGLTQQAPRGSSRPP